MIPDFSFESHSETVTQNFGYFLGQQIARPLTVLLQGDLGAGKSVLARGVARGLGVPDEVPITSPTFTLMNHYSARIDLYHFDLYRLSDADELLEIGFDEFAHALGVALIEWPERMDDFNFDHLHIEIKRLSAEARTIRVHAHGDAAQHLLTQVRCWRADIESV